MLDWSLMIFLIPPPPLPRWETLIISSVVASVAASVVASVVVVGKWAGGECRGGWRESEGREGSGWVMMECSTHVPQVDVSHGRRR